MAAEVPGSTDSPSGPSGPTAARAAGITLAPVVQTALKEALPTVAAHAVEAIIAEVPSYAEARAYLEGNIESAVQLALGSFLTIAARADDPSTPLGPAREASYALGRGEARSGRSMDALLSAYRIGARVSWRELSTVAVGAGMSAPLLAQFAELVFAYIDELSAASVAGHSDELASAERVQQRLLERLALDLLRGAPEEVLTRRSERAGWPLPRTLTVLLVPDALLRAARGLAGPGALLLAEDLPGQAPGEDVTALLVPDLKPGARRRLVRALGERPAVLGPERPWPAASASYRRALRAWRLLDGEQRGGHAAYDTEDHLAELVLAADPDAVADLRARALAPMADLTEAAREKLEETLRLWLLHRGRREAVAEDLFVHPQTVRYRLGQLRDLFGDQLDDPVAVLDLVVALGAPTPPSATP
jgi:PucR-like helix-turn-helix protein